MSRTFANTHFDAAQWEAVDQAILGLERALVPMLLGLRPGDRRRLVKMGGATEAFCRRAYDAMCTHAALLPPVINVEDMGRDLATHDALAVRLGRLDRVMETATDADLALGSDVTIRALEGYAFLRLAGKVDGLHGLGRDPGTPSGHGGPGRPASAPA